LSTDIPYRRHVIGSHPGGLDQLVLLDGLV